MASCCADNKIDEDNTLNPPQATVETKKPRLGTDLVVEYTSKRERKRDEQRRWRAKLSSERKEAEREMGKLRRRKHRLHMSNDKVQEIKLKDRIYQQKRRLKLSADKQEQNNTGVEQEIDLNKRQRVDNIEDGCSNVTSFDDGDDPWYYNL
jgi:hypothetical protein